MILSYTWPAIYLLSYSYQISEWKSEKDIGSCILLTVNCEVCLAGTQVLRLLNETGRFGY